MAEMIGYEESTQERDYDVEGITGQVTRGSIESCQYPCFILYAGAEDELPKYKLSVLHSMIVSQKVSNDLTQRNSINVYLTDNTNTIRLGNISPRQVKSILKLFEGCRLEAYLNSSKKLEGDYMYILSE